MSDNSKKGASSKHTSGSEVCPTCGKTFKQLSRHKCKASAKSEEDSTTAQTAEAAPLPDGSDDRNTGETGVQECPTCRKQFKQLSRHKCKVSAKSEEDSTTAQTAEAAPLPDGSDDRNTGETGVQEFPSNRPLIDTETLTTRADDLMERLEIRYSDQPVREGNDFFDKEVRLSQEEKSKAMYKFKPFQKKILEMLEEDTKCSWKGLRSGSYYDGTKVTRADEVDCMLHPCQPVGSKSSQWMTAVFHGAPPGFCFLKLNQQQFTNNPDPYTELLRQCSEGDWLSSRLYREKTVAILEKATTEKRLAEKSDDMKPGSAAYTVILRTTTPPINIDLVPCIHLNGWPEVAEKGPVKNFPEKEAKFIKTGGFDVIPKECNQDGYDEHKDFLWRLSFSRAEKRMTLYADGKLAKMPSQSTGKQSSDAVSSFDSDDELDDTFCSDTSTPCESKSKKDKVPPTCRKSVLRVLKRILEIIKGIDNSRSKEPGPQFMSLRKAAEALRAEREFGPDFKIEKFTTFQVRTLMWTEFYVTYPGNHQWTRESRRSRLMHALGQLTKMVSGKMNVTHFFLPDLNIMGEVPIEEREFLFIMFSVAKRLF